MTYAQATQFLGQGRDKSSRPFANNTRIETRQDGIAIKLHATDIATILPDDGVTLRDGGWRTVTTKDRMTNSLPQGWRLYSHKGEWYLTFGGWEGDLLSHLYKDGVTVWPDGRIKGQGTESDKTKQAKLRKRILAYSRTFAAKVVAGDVPLPGAGDCWYCGMHTVEDGKPLGDSFHNVDHLMAHMTESYFVPSLVFNAFESRGQSIAMKSSLYAKCSGDSKGDWRLSYFQAATAKAIRGYMYRAFGLA